MVGLKTGLALRPLTCAKDPDPPPVAGSAPPLHSRPAVAATADGPDKWREVAIKNGYKPVKTWDRQLNSTGRYIRRELMVGPAGHYRLIATDHDAAGNSNGAWCAISAQDGRIASPIS